MSTLSKPQNDCTVQHSALLHLPGEIRNQIYSYVLRTDTGLCYPHDKAINHIQYVCQALRAEAAWLELKPNPVVTFDGDPKSITATKRFLTFSSYIPIEQRCRLQVVRLRTVGEDTFRDHVVECEWSLISLTTLCKQNLQLKVEYRPASSARYDSLEAPLLLVMASFHASRILRQQVHDPTMLPHPGLKRHFQHKVDAAMEEQLAALLKDASPAVKNVRARIRFHPPQDVLKPEMFLADTAHGQYTNLGRTQGLLPSWEAIVKRWSEDGL